MSTDNPTLLGSEPAPRVNGRSPRDPSNSANGTVASLPPGPMVHQVQTVNSRIPCYRTRRRARKTFELAGSTPVQTSALGRYMGRRSSPVRLNAQLFPLAPGATLLPGFIVHRATRARLMGANPSLQRVYERRIVLPPPAALRASTPSSRPRPVLTSGGRRRGLPEQTQSGSEPPPAAASGFALDAAGPEGVGAQRRGEVIKSLFGKPLSGGSR